MRDMSSSSAVPTDLDVTAFTAETTAELLARHADRASLAVSTYQLRCRGSAVSDPGPAVRRHTGSLTAIARFTSVTSAAFVRADSGSAGSGSSTSKPTTTPTTKPNSGSGPPSPSLKAIENQARASGAPLNYLYAVADPDDFAAYAAAAQQGQVATFGADWSNDGCSDHGAVTRDYDRPGCLRHDFAYRNWFRFKGNETISNKEAAKKLQPMFDAQLASDSTLLGIRAGRSAKDASKHGYEIYVGLRTAAKLGFADMTKRPDQKKSAPPTSAPQRTSAPPTTRPVP
jgi:hypothetical protein